MITNNDIIYFVLTDRFRKGQKNSAAPVQIPGQIEQRFRGKPNSDSEGKQTRIPRETEHVLKERSTERVSLLAFVGRGSECA